MKETLPVRCVRLVSAAVVAFDDICKWFTVIISINAPMTVAPIPAISAQRFSATVYTITIDPRRRCKPMFAAYTQRNALLYVRTVIRHLYGRMISSCTLRLTSRSLLIREFRYYFWNKANNIMESPLTSELQDYLLQLLIQPKRCSFSCVCGTRFRRVVYLKKHQKTCYAAASALASGLPTEIRNYEDEQELNIEMVKQAQEELINKGVKLDAKAFFPDAKVEDPECLIIGVRQNPPEPSTKSMEGDFPPIEEHMEDAAIPNDPEMPIEKIEA